MKYFCIANTNFGYKNNSIEWSNNMKDYFYESFIPLLKKYKKEGDVLVHLGNLFCSQDINIKTLNLVINIFDEISTILPIKFIVGKLDKQSDVNIYSIFRNNPNIEIIQETTVINGVKYIPINNNVIKDTEIVFTSCDSYEDGIYSNNKINSPYPLDKNAKFNGFYVAGQNNFKFIENTFSPKFGLLKINRLEQIDQIDSEWVKNNYIDVLIDKSFIDSKELKLEILLSKYDFKTVSYINEKEEFIGNNEIVNIEEIIKDKIKDNEALKEEFELVKKIYTEKTMKL